METLNAHDLDYKGNLYVVRLQETQRDGQDAIAHAGYGTVLGGKHATKLEKEEMHGVRLMIK